MFNYYHRCKVTHRGERWPYDGICPNHLDTGSYCGKLYSLNQFKSVIYKKKNHQDIFVHSLQELNIHNYLRNLPVIFNYKTIWLLSSIFVEARRVEWMNVNSVAIYPRGSYYRPTKIKRLKYQQLSRYWRKENGQ